MSFPLAREIDAILVTELLRWGRSSQGPRADATVKAETFFSTSAREPSTKWRNRDAGDQRNDW
jgi:hypothetical protein